MKTANYTKYFFLVLILMIGFGLYLQNSIEKSTRTLHALGVSQAEQHASRIVDYLKRKTDGDIKGYLLTHQEKRKEINTILNTFLTNEFKYIFLLTKDQHGHYRFLLDGSLSEDWNFNTIFFPENRAFDSVYKSGKPQIIEETKGDVDEVWRSLLYPVVGKHGTDALLVIDFSEKYASSINHLNAPIAKTVSLMQIFLLLSLLLISAMVYSYYKFRKKIMTDPLTSVGTKTFFHEFLRRHSLDEYDIVLVNLDDFKRINQKFGYKNGDKLLKLYAKTLCNTLPEGAHVIRIGGSEFALLLPRGGDLEESVKSLFETLREKKYLIGNETVSLNASMPAMRVPKGARSEEKILHLLDRKMLDIKSRGKNDYAVIVEKPLDDLKYSDIEFIKTTLEEERITCLFQPICRTQTKEVVKFEALVRMIDDEDPEKLIPPHYFLPVIKGTNQYTRMSKLVFQKVFDVLQKYQAIEVSINLDLTDLYHRDMMKLIDDTLYEHQALAKRLTFEIVEDVEVKDFDKVAHIFKQLRAYGSKIALDDFGSGYASYAYLIKLDWDIIKIDGSLVRALLTNPDRTELIVRSINELGVYFNCEVVAEFVEDEEIYKVIKHLCVEYSQGHYFGKPQPIEAYADLHNKFTIFKLLRYNTPLSQSN